MKKFSVKNVKIVVLLCMAIIVGTALTSCLSIPLKKNIEGFDTYENKNLGIKIQYPGDWMYRDDSISEEDFYSSISQVFGDESAQYFSDIFDPNAVSAIWYDFKNSDDVFTPNANLIIDNASGTTQNDLKSPANQKDFEAQLEDSYKQAMGDFTPIENIKGKMMGSNYFLIYKIKYAVNLGEGDLYIACYQAITVKYDKLYIFSFTIFDDKLNGMIPKYEKMLSTLEFIK